MNYTKKIRIIAIVAFFVACLSLGIGYSSLNTTLEINGTATVAKKEYKVGIDNIHELSSSDGTASFLRQPVLTDESNINFAVNLKQSLAEVSFFIDILNEGNVDVIIDKINLTGIEGYESYVEYKIDGVQEKEKILAGGKKENIKIILKYKDISENHLLMAQDINLDNINVAISFKQL